MKALWQQLGMAEPAVHFGVVNCQDCEMPRWD